MWASAISTIALSQIERALCFPVGQSHACVFSNAIKIFQSVSTGIKLWSSL